MMLSWIRNLKTIAPTSVVATICLAYSFIVIFGQFVCMHATPYPSQPHHSSPPTYVHRASQLHHVDVEYDIGHLGKTVQLDPTCDATTVLNVTTICATNTGVVAFAGDLSSH